MTSESPLHYPADYYDGRSARRRQVAATLSPLGLSLRGADGKTVLWPYASLRLSPGGFAGQPVQLEHEIREADGVRVEILSVQHPQFLDALKEKYPDGLPGEWNLPRHQGKRRLLVFASLVLIPAILFGLWRFAIPALADRVAMTVPVSWEEKLTEKILEVWNLDEQPAPDPKVQQAVDAIMQRLLDTVPDQPYSFKVYIIDRKAVNALALPAGTIVVFQGLLNATQTPEELAGVLAHEIQHALMRHSTRGLVRQAATGMAMALIMGDAGQVLQGAVGVADELDSLRHSRSMEREADREGMKMILAAKIDPEGMVRMFQTLKKEEGKYMERIASGTGSEEEEAGEWTEFLSTHPAGSDRIARLRQIAAESAGTEILPLLPKMDWTRMHKKLKSKTEKALEEEE